jgi:hypothetical protein
LALAAIAGAALLAASSASASSGEVNFVRNAKSSFDPILTGSSDAERAWMRDHYWRMRGYAPFFNQALGWAPPSHFYQDLYAIYNDGEGEQTVAQHPDWVLRDAQGRRLFIPYGCGGGSCPQYAADVGNPEFREQWIAEAGSRLAAGYEGIFIDDVNLEMRVGNGAGDEVRPIDPRTGSQMSVANWRRYVAEFTEEIRDAFPDVEIVHNSLWWVDHSNPYVKRQTDAADVIELERGFNDPGLTGGGGKYGYRTYLDHVEWVHSRGASVLLEPYDLTKPKARYELASYFLARGKKDAIASEYKADPGEWWPGWDADLGKPRGKRMRRQGVFQRRYRNGLALVNEPGAKTRTVRLPRGKRWHTLGGKRVRRVRLGAAEGVVVKSAR